MAWNSGDSYNLLIFGLFYKEYILFALSLPISTETLRDKFVCGLQQKYIRSRLLTEEDNLTFDRSVEIATALEGAKKHAHLIQQETKKEEVHRTTRRHNTFNPRSSTIVCFRCGGPHAARACRFIKEKCHNCGKTGQGVSELYHKVSED